LAPKNSLAWLLPHPDTSTNAATMNWRVQARISVTGITPLHFQDTGFASLITKVTHQLPKSLIRNGVAQLGSPHIRIFRRVLLDHLGDQWSRERFDRVLARVVVSIKLA
jgi:hypothetical protein